MACVGLLLVWSTGCNSSPSGPPPAITPVEVHEHGHGHDHDHGHAHESFGPNGGHLVEFQSEDYHAEWLHDDESGQLTVFILDRTAKVLAPITAQHITIEKKIGDKTERYELRAAQPSDNSSKAAKFETVDKPLIEALKSAGQGVDAKLLVEIEGQTFEGKFEHHDHGHDHGHGHGHKH
jgi:hypothetical protein